ncbi:MAG TPA: cache domain-containing protein [Acidimicrobiia bacterium]|nr:cache domain-containing protein [Acidimicrobiia bacterium]
MSRFVKLMLAFLLIIGLLSAMFSGVAVRLIGDRVLAEAQNRVDSDLNAAQEMFDAYADRLFDLVRLSADRFYLRNALLANYPETALGELIGTMLREELDFLTMTDADGVVLLRAGNPGTSRDNQADDALLASVLGGGEPAVAASVFAADRLAAEAPLMVERAALELLETSAARPRDEAVETSGLVLVAAAPIVDYEGQVIGCLYGGLLLTRRVDIVDLIKETVFAGERYQGVDIGTATIFLDDVRIATNVLNADGTRALGTRVSEEVYEQVVGEGRRWVGRAYVVNDWYITAYEPLRDFQGTVVGMLYVGILEQPYTDLRTRISLLFGGIALAGVALAVVISYVISRRLSTPIRALVKAARRVSSGDLDAQVPVGSKDEVGALATAFNSMAESLKAREEQLKEFARRKVMESERLAVVGQLAADVAHELNNPLQGIVTYSHLLLERLPADDVGRSSVEKIATQAARCVTIIRGLLDFSRPKKPQKQLANLCAIIEECFSLVEARAAFHNIEVVRDYTEPIPEAVVDPAQMQQVFINLIMNAAEAMGGAGRLSVTTRFEPTRGAIQITFRDTGHGIREEDIGRIFDPFFTTKEVGHGTGLGLAISFGIIKEHGGTITVESKAGEGTAFTVELPLGMAKGMVT